MTLRCGMRRFSDFAVNEVDLAGRIVQLTVLGSGEAEDWQAKKQKGAQGAATVSDIAGSRLQSEQAVDTDLQAPDRQEDIASSVVR